MAQDVAHIKAAIIVDEQQRAYREKENAAKNPAAARFAVGHDSYIPWPDSGVCGAPGPGGGIAEGPAGGTAEEAQGA
ncbi:MAG: hypothetical protein PVS2B2_25050 [Candidatus Acidiferrum sp.]